MRRRFLSLAMTLVMALTLLPATAWADGEGVTCEETPCNHQASMDGKHYDTLRDAVEAVHDSGYTGTGKITLLDDVEDGLGVAIGYGTFNPKTGVTGGDSRKGLEIEIDFNTHTYTIASGPVGSNTTVSNGFQLLQNSVVKLKNGTLTSRSGSGVRMLVQNYSDLTLENMTLDGTNIGYGQYTMSNNCGDINITGNTNIIASTGGIALDVCDFGSYPSVSVTFDEGFTGIVSGPIEYAGTNTKTDKLTIESAKGTFGEIVVATYGSTEENKAYAQAAITGAIAVSGGNFSSVLPTAYCTSSVVQLVDEDGKSQVVDSSSTDTSNYITVSGENGVYYTDEDAVAQYNEAKVDMGGTITYYPTLEAAIDAVKTTSATITLLDDVTVSETVKLPDGVKLDGDGKTITADFTSAGHVIEIVNATTGVTIQNLEIDGGYNSASDPVKAGIHAFASDNVQLSNVTITNCGTVGLQINGSAVTASELDISDSKWGSVNVDDGSSGETPSFIFNSGNLEDDVQIYTELKDTTPVITVGTGTNLTAVNSGGEATDPTGLKGFVYYTDNPAKLGEAFNATTNTVYETLGEALEDAANNNTPDTIHVIDDATLSQNMTVESGDTLSVSSGVELTIGTDKTLTVEGTLNNSGIIDGKVAYGEDSTHTVRVIFSLSPNTATVSVAGAAPVSGSANEFLLNSNTTYSYTVSASGYYSQTGTLAVGDTPITQPVTLTRIPTSTGSSSSNDYAISVDAGRHGDVTVRPSRAERGETVTITVEPDTGYELDELIVTDSSGDEISVRDRGNGRYTFTMPRSRVTIEATFVAVEDSGLPFIDVAENAWYADAVAYAYENGLMSGTASNLFSPDATTTRGMIVTMLYRLEGEPRVTTGSAFDDVDAAMYYVDAIAWANANGIVTGYDEATFGPNDAITREQMAAILYRYAQYKGYDTTQGGMAIREYADYESISEYALIAMDWAVNAGLVTGTTSSTLTPDGSAVRAQVATIFMRFMEDVAG